MDITNQQYKQYHDKASAILEEISQYLDIPIVNIRWQHFKMLLEEKYNITIHDYINFSGKVAQRVAGSLYADPNGGEMGVNTSAAQPKGRQHFTLVHEGVHFICDVRTHNFPQFFSSILAKRKYSPEEQAQENNANYIAGILMCNDKALTEALSSGNDIYDLCENFDFTQSAAWTRIFNFLKFTCNIPTKRAATIASAYRSGETVERRNFLNVLIKEFHSFSHFVNTQTFFSSPNFDKLYRKLNTKTKTASHFYQFQSLVDSLYQRNGKICPFCRTTYFGNLEYCRLCGHNLILNTYIHKGDRYNMNVAIDLNEDGICKACPHCGANNPNSNLICTYCGAFLRNECSGVTPINFVNYVLNSADRWTDNTRWLVKLQEFNGSAGIIPGEILKANISDSSKWHDSIHLLPGYARFCDTCGCVSTLYLQRLLPDIELPDTQPTTNSLSE